MSTQLHRSHHFPDLTLPDHCGQIVRLSQLTAADEFSRRLGFTEGRPLIVVFYRGFFCPRDRLQLSQLTAFYPERLCREVCYNRLSLILDSRVLCDQ